MRNWTIHFTGESFYKNATLKFTTVMVELPMPDINIGDKITIEFNNGDTYGGVVEINKTDTRLSLNKKFHTILNEKPVYFNSLIIKPAHREVYQESVFFYKDWIIEDFV